MSRLKTGRIKRPHQPTLNIRPHEYAYRYITDLATKDGTDRPDALDKICREHDAGMQGKVPNEG
jgi:hypothetical protein